MSKLNVKHIISSRKDNPYLCNRKIEKQAWAVIAHLTKHKTATNDELQAVVKTGSKQVRKIIQHIREYNHRFFNPSKTYYIVATSKGYELTRSENKLKNYELRLKSALLSKGKQLNEIQIAQNLNEMKGSK